MFIVQEAARELLMTCIMPCLFGFSAPHLGEGVIQEHAQRGGEEEGRRRGGRKRQKGELCPLIVQLSLSVMIKIR